MLTAGTRDAAVRQVGMHAALVSSRSSAVAAPRAASWFRFKPKRQLLSANLTREGSSQILVPPAAIACNAAAASSGLRGAAGFRLSAHAAEATPHTRPNTGAEHTA